MQGFARFSAESVREYGLTHAQFDIVATLGNTAGMSYKELGEKTLITKGTLTGVIDRLEQKGLVARVRSCTDKRSYFVRLTPCGEALFAEVFPKVVAQGKLLFAGYTEADFAAIETPLAQLKQTISSASGALVSPSTPELKEPY